METTKNYRFGTVITEIVMVLIGLLFLIPFYFLFVNSVKTFGDLLTNSVRLAGSIPVGQLRERLGEN